MNSLKLSPRFLMLSGMILVAALIRLLPHPPNFAPIAAMALLEVHILIRKHSLLLFQLLQCF